ncbi:MAG: TetR/AcrR family transcriptional regulator [Alphaproteobacteria bacterium]|nr:TetR/AcrR family transcriptional regulator [Alphaproteobacteria bacterium]
MARQTRTARQAETRSKFIAAASGAFAVHGFSGAKVERIAEVAGYSRGAFYSNFSSKEELALAVFERLLNDDVEGVSALLETHDGNTDTLFRRLAEGFAVRHADEVPSALRIELLMQAWRDADFRVAAAQLYRRQRARYAELVAITLGQASLIPPDTVVAIADTLLAVDHGHSVLALAGAEPTPVADVVFLLLRGIASTVPIVAAERQTD